MGLTRVQADCLYDPGNIKASDRSNDLLDANRISVLNWNIYKAREENWARDFDQLIKGQDIVLLQEAVLKEVMYQPLNRTHLNWNLNTAFYYDDVEAGVLTASTARPVRSCGLRAQEPLTRIPKTMLVSEYRLSRGTDNLLVTNIHGINFTLGTEAYGQQIAALADAIREHHGPLIVAGDFNTWSDDRMAIVKQMAEQLSLKAVTYRNHNRLTIFGNPLDHVFYRGLELVREESIEVTSSDHNPIKATFRLATAKPTRISL